jgi:hypothetical protein
MRGAGAIILAAICLAACGKAAAPSAASKAGSPQAKIAVSADAGPLLTPRGMAQVASSGSGRVFSTHFSGSQSAAKLMHAFIASARGYFDAPPKLGQTTHDLHDLREQAVFSGTWHKLPVGGTFDVVATTDGGMGQMIIDYADRLPTSLKTLTAQANDALPASALVGAPEPASPQPPSGLIDSAILGAGLAAGAADASGAGQADSSAAEQYFDAAPSAPPTAATGADSDSDSALSVPGISDDDDDSTDQPASANGSGGLLDDGTGGTSGLSDDPGIASSPADSSLSDPLGPLPDESQPDDSGLDDSTAPAQSSGSAAPAYPDPATDPLGDGGGTPADGTGSGADSAATGQ